MSGLRPNRILEKIKIGNVVDPDQLQSLRLLNHPVIGRMQKAIQIVDLEQGVEE